MSIITKTGGAHVVLDLSADQLYMNPLSRVGRLVIQLQSDTLTAAVKLKVLVAEKTDLAIASWPDATDQNGDPIILNLVAGATPVIQNIGNISAGLVFALDFGAVGDTVNVVFKSM